MKSRESAGPTRLRPPRLGSGKLDPAGPLRSGRGAALLIAGVILLGINMRTAITSLPPIFPELQSALHLSAATLSLLAAIPVLCFGVFSGAGAPLSRRFGEERVLGLAVALLAAGLLLRSLSPAALLFPGTVVAGAAIALLNVLLPSLVKRRMPERAGLIIGLYLLMLSGGAIAASALAVPVFNAAGNGASAGSASVRIALGLWAAPAVLAAVMWLPQLRYRTVPGAPQAVQAAGVAADVPEDAAARPSGAVAMGRSALAWQVTFFMGLQSLSYYATLSWFPTMFRDRGVSAVHAGDLLALMNLGNAVTCLLIPVLAHRAADQRKLAVAAVAATGVGISGAIFGPAALAPGFIALLGLGQGATLGLAIFYTMARAPDPATAASLSAFAQGVGYLLASTGPLTIGFLHNATGGWTLPAVVLLAVAAAQLATGWLAGRALTVPAAIRHQKAVPQSG
ncbi:MAG TPA: MFS transporter [Streptosporangiaceae bacterium]|nr:MFS transporter [Streptosporangiaceae bacterium]